MSLVGALITSVVGFPFRHTSCTMKFLSAEFSSCVTCHADNMCAALVTTEVSKHNPHCVGLTASVTDRSSLELSCTIVARVMAESVVAMSPCVSEVSVD